MRNGTGKISACYADADADADAVAVEVVLCVL